MKKFKKPLALILALMMAFSAMVIPAGAADEDEGIMPLGPAMRCPCGGTISLYYGTPYTTYENYPAGCSAHPGEGHFHELRCRDEYYRCDTCGTEHEIGYTVLRETCPFQ